MTGLPGIAAVSTDASAVLLLGVSTSYSGQDDVPAAARNLSALGEVLASPAVWGIPTGHRMQTAVNPTNDTMLTLAGDSATLTEPGGMLVIYFAGHAQVRDGTLYLSPPTGRPADPVGTMMPLDRLVNHVNERCEAGRRLLILDCCHAGAGVGSLPTELQEVGTPSGWLLLAATGRQPVDAGTGHCTPFTSYLLRTLSGGCGTERYLSPNAIIQNCRTLAEQDPQTRFPVRPRTNGAAWANEPWVRNVAYNETETTSAALTPAEPDQPRPIASGRRGPPASLCRLVQRGRPVALELHHGVLRRTDESVTAGQLISAGGDALALVDGARLHACLARAGGDLQPLAPADLTRLGQGDILAIARSGRADLALLWADRSGTHIVRVRADTGEFTVIGTASSVQATAGVLGPGRALLVDDQHRCPAFPGATVTRIAAASSGGRTLVLAAGTDEQGEGAAWLEVGGSDAHQLQDAGVFLEITHGSRRPPEVLDTAGLPMPSPAPGVGRTRWGRWTPIGLPTAPVPA